MQIWTSYWMRTMKPFEPIVLRLFINNNYDKTRAAND